MLASQLALHLL